MKKELFEERGCGSCGGSRPRPTVNRPMRPLRPSKPR